MCTSPSGTVSDRVARPVARCGTPSACCARAMLCAAALRCTLLSPMRRDSNLLSDVAGAKPDHAAGHNGSSRGLRGVCDLPARIRRWLLYTTPGVQLCHYAAGYRGLLSSTMRCVLRDALQGCCLRRRRAVVGVLPQRPGGAHVPAPGLPGREAGAPDEELLAAGPAVRPRCGQNAPLHPLLLRLTSTDSTSTAETATERLPPNLMR
jgi:hypothetical protein